jgi:hypothetical protein
MADEHPNLDDRSSEIAWFICKRENGTCEIVQSQNQDPIPDSLETWGSFATRGEAIAKRVGLIRAGKCLPI